MQFCFVPLDKEATKNWLSSNPPPPDLTLNQHSACRQTEDLASLIYSQLAGMFPLALEAAIVKLLKDEQPGLAFFYAPAISFRKKKKKTYWKTSTTRHDFTCALLKVNTQTALGFLRRPVQDFYDHKKKKKENKRSLTFGTLSKFPLVYLNHMSLKRPIFSSV